MSGFVTPGWGRFFYRKGRSLRSRRRAGMVIKNLVPTAVASALDTYSTVP